MFNEILSTKNNQEQNKFICEICNETNLNLHQIEKDNNNYIINVQFSFKNIDELNSHNINSHPILVDENIYLGNMYQSADLIELKRLKITHILNCAVECKNHFLEEFTYCNCELDDDSEFPIEDYFTKAVEFISSSVNSGKIFVHCKLGRSRSASMILAYFIKIKKMNFDDALKKLTTIKPLVTPNPGFVAKLKQLK